MASPLQPGDHYILHKLCDELLPWMIGGKLLRRQWFVRTAAVYSYTSDLSAALAGLGIGTPLAALAAGKTPEGKNAFDVLREALPAPWFWVGGAALIAWVILRLVVQREGIIARALLARDCAQHIRMQRAELWASLPNTNPIAKITEIQKSVNDSVQNAIKNSAWPWDPLPPEAEIGPELAMAIDEIRTKFMSRWAPAPPGGI